MEYRGSITRLCVYWLSINGLLATILFVTDTRLHTGTVLLCIVNILYLISVFNRPFKFVIQDQSLEIHYLLSLFKRSKVVAVREVECTFNYEVRARGGRVKVFKIIYNNEAIAEVVPDFNGWHEKHLMEILEALRDIKKSIQGSEE